MRFSVVSEAADEALELDCDHATPTLKEIVCSAAPSPLYVKYHDAYLRRYEACTVNQTHELHTADVLHRVYCRQEQCDSVLQRIQFGLMTRAYASQCCILLLRFFLLLYAPG